MRTTSALATAVLAVVGLVVSLTVLWPRLDAGTPVPGAGAGPSVSAPAAVPDPARDAVPDRGRDRVAAAPGRVDATLPAAHPDPPRTVGVRVPTAGIDSRVRPVGVTPDGQMALPPDPEVLGWYRFGPAPGSGTGSVVLAGHLDSVRYGLGPLVGLREVEVGDDVGVARADGTIVDYTVVEVTRYDRQALPAELFARTGSERLRLITCGGAYLADQGGYQENLVVTAVPG